MSPDFNTSVKVSEEGRKGPDRAWGTAAEIVLKLFSGKKSLKDLVSAGDKRP